MRAFAFQCPAIDVHSWDDWPLPENMLSFGGKIWAGEGMRKLETIAVPIQRDYAAAYALLADPRNYPRWSPVPDGLFEAADDSSYLWRVDLPRGRRLMRFCRPNEYGVLDYEIMSETGAPEYVAHLRLIPNEEGAVLVAHYLQRPGLSDEAFASDVEWAMNDLRSVAVVIETL